MDKVYVVVEAESVGEDYSDFGWIVVEFDADLLKQTIEYIIKAEELNCLKDFSCLVFNTAQVIVLGKDIQPFPNVFQQIGVLESAPTGELYVPEFTLIEAFEGGIEVAVYGMNGSLRTVTPITLADLVLVESGLDVCVF